MTTCLDDLNVSLQGIENALEASEGVQPINISLSSSSESAAISASSSVSISRANAVSIAMAAAVAINWVQVDNRLEQNLLVNLILPPVSQTTPPNLTEYPTEQTRVTDTPTTTAVDGEACQLIHLYVQAIASFFGILARAQSTNWIIPTALIQYLEIAMKTLRATDQPFPLPSQVASAILEHISGLAAEGQTVATVALTEASVYLTLNEDDVSNEVYCQLIDLDVGTVEASLYLNDHWGGEAISEAARALLGLAFSPSLMAAILYAPEWAIPATTYECSSCGP